MSEICKEHEAFAAQEGECLACEVFDLRRERDEARDVAIGKMRRNDWDNHHNAAMCPYCKGQMAEVQATLARWQSLARKLGEALQKGPRCGFIERNDAMSDLRKLEVE